MLAPDVAHVCVNGIREFEIKYRADEVLQLSEIVKRRYGYVARKSSDFAKQLNEIILNAIRQLERREQLAAVHNFGLYRYTSYGKPLKAREEEAAKEYGKVVNKKITADTYRQKPQYERTIIVNVGQEIEKQDAEIAEEKERNRAEAGPLGTYKQYTTTYVHRPDYHEEFEVKLGEGLKAIAFVGPPGVGKTRLVDEILAGRIRRAGDSRLDFECGDLGRFISDIAVKLHESKVQAPAFD